MPPQKNLLDSCSLKPVKRMRNPRFGCHQTVRFFGGIGKIKDIRRQDICWIYHVEMSQGVEPDFGRIGAETTIVLEEHDIRQVVA
jgi:hypothetical protein